MLLDRYVLDRKIRSLRRTRDQLARMVRDGSAEAQKLWADLERRWSDLESQTRHPAPGTEDALGGAADRVLVSITELRRRYDELASELRHPRAERLSGKPGEAVRQGRALDHVHSGFETTGASPSVTCR